VSLTDRRRKQAKARPQAVGDKGDRTPASHDQSR
jgi:hypothetical protein